MLVISDGSLDDRLHLVVIEAAKRGRPEVTRRGQLEHHGRDGLVVGGFDHAHDVVLAHRPVHMRYPRSVLLGERVGLIAPADGIPVGPDPMIGPAHISTARSSCKWTRRPWRAPRPSHPRLRHPIPNCRRHYACATTPLPKGKASRVTFAVTRYDQSRSGFSSRSRSAGEWPPAAGRSILAFACVAAARALL